MDCRSSDGHRDELLAWFILMRNCYYTLFLKGFHRDLDKRDIGNCIASYNRILRFMTSIKLLSFSLKKIKINFYLKIFFIISFSYIRELMMINTLRCGPYRPAYCQGAGSVSRLAERQSASICSTADADSWVNAPSFTIYVGTQSENVFFQHKKFKM